MHEIEAKKGINLDPQQKEALLGIATSTQKVHTLTAMPGCGKTAIMEFLAQLVQKDEEQKLEIDFMAPTGKASKVLNGRVKPYGLSATTIHAAIGWGGLPQTVEADIVVVDESSMVDLPLMYQFLSRTNPKAHLIFIGDPDQLPSVGPGHILHDVLKMPFDHHQLKEVHRNAGDILNLVKTIKRGEYETFHGKDVMTYGLPDPTDKMEKFLDLYTKEVSKRPDGLKKVGLLTGMRKGDPTKPGWNVTYLNRALQERYNPYGATVSGLSVREGDRIIVRKNQRFETEDVKTKTAKVEYIANGDTGVLKEVVFKESNKIDSIQLALDDGRHLTLPGDVLTTMDLGYALTIHQAQGSEFECAFVVMQNGQPGLFNRKLFYTGVSRAKDQLYLFGDRTTFKSLVHRTGEKRYSKLVERVMNTIDAEAHYQQDDQLILFEEDGAASVSSNASAPVQTNSKRPRF
jgi:exodeoxyribonuclease V alpha subunit